MAAQNPRRSIFVYADWQELEQLAPMGILYASPVRGKEVFSFEYDETWLQSGQAQELDPDLQLFPGPQYLEESKSNFGLFLDSSPDRWGRVLMTRREAALARLEGRRERTLLETDYLLGVFDGHRLGALRFKEEPEGPFLNNNKEMASPPWTSIRELEYASFQLEREDLDDVENLKWLGLLLAPGASLGGSRPKASVLDEKGNLWIAKFPSTKDTHDIGAWETVVLELARQAGLNVPEARTGKYYSNQHTFLTRRFDRTNGSRRIHFASAMTLLGYTDGTDYHDGVSYLNIAEFIIRNGANVTTDLEELWRRIVFYITVSNTDDHLSNHGFLLTKNGWVLSPAYDINPVETGTGLSLNISETSNSLDLGLAIEVAPYFRVSEKRAKEIIGTVKKSVAPWPSLAEKTGIPKSEREMMARAFKI